jgi:hypothetical protein
LSRQILTSYDDRKVFPKLEFDEQNNLIKLVAQGYDTDDLINPPLEIVDISDNIKTAPFLTGLAASSLVEKVAITTFKQNF